MDIQDLIKIVDIGAIVAHYYYYNHLTATTFSTFTQKIISSSISLF